MKNKLYALIVAVTLSALFLPSCKKHVESTADTRLLNKAIAAYEQQRAKFQTTKSSNIYDVVKPLPGDFTPQWELAVEKQEGAVMATTVPVDADIQYQAVYPCKNNQTEHAEHHHTAIPVVQKMAVVISSDSAVCYIVNIVPYEGCNLGQKEIEEGFLYRSGLDGFSGFAAYHNFDGSVAFIEQYKDGVWVRSSGSDDAAFVSEITRNVKLYNNPDDMSIGYNKGTKIADGLPPALPAAKCFCGNLVCKHPNHLYYHCVNCHQESSVCKCFGRENRCPYCGLLKADDIESRKCHCPDWSAFIDYPKCLTCGSVNCYISHKNNSSSPTCLACGDESCQNRLSTRDKHVAHADVIRTLFKSVLSTKNLHELQSGCHYMDVMYNTERDAYAHGVTDKFYTVDVQVDYEALKRFFIDRAKYFKYNNAYVDLGMAFHPLLDSYLSIRDRVEFSFNYYSYDRPAPIINEQYLQSSLTLSSYRVTNMLRLYNTILSLPSDVTSEQLGLVFEAWRYSHSKEAEMQ